MKQLFDAKKVNELIAANKVAENEGKDIKEAEGTGVALIKSATPGKTRNGNPRFSGSVENQETVQYNVWCDTPAYQTLSSAQIIPGETVADISYSIGKFGLVIKAITILDDPAYTREMFVYSKYDQKELEDDLNDTLNKCGLTEKGRQLLKIIFGIGTENNIFPRFSKEQAAMNHHDNCESGLLAHTLKCLRIYSGIRPIYRTFNDERTNDALIIGLMVHDVGKIWEMHHGNYTPNSFVTHRLLGAEHLTSLKEQIVDLYDNEFYYHLLAIVDQHHDEYGEPAKTVYAYIAHMIDDMEAKLTVMNEVIMKNHDSGNPSDYMVRMSSEKGGDRFLTFFRPVSEDKE